MMGIIYLILAMHIKPKIKLFNNFSGLFITAYFGGNNHTPILITASKLDVWNMDMVTQERRQRAIDHGYLNGGSGHSNSSRSIE